VQKLISLAALMGFSQASIHVRKLVSRKSTSLAALVGSESAVPLKHDSALLESESCFEPPKHNSSLLQAASGIPEKIIQVVHI
jgi:hypothetical protein